MFHGSLCRRSGWLVVALVALVGVRAQAVPCSTLPNPVYIAGTTTGHPMLQQVSARMAAQAVTYVFQERASCDAVRAIASYPNGGCSGADCLSGTAQYYKKSTTASGVIDTLTCEIDTPTAADIALSDFFLNHCAPGTDPAAVADIRGPVRALVFVTPRPIPGTSFPRTITAAEAYMAFGFAVGNVPPWTDPDSLYLPGPQSTTQQLLSMFLQIPVDQLVGTVVDGEPGVMNALNQSVCKDRSKSLGVVGSDFYDQHRGDELAALAFVGSNQTNAFYPDYNSYPNYTSFPSAYINTGDKQNVRDGHYALWSYLHMIARADPQTGEPINAEAVRLEHFLYATQPIGVAPDTYDVYRGALDSRLIPECAMKVARAEEAGPLANYADPAPCGCAFAASAPGSPTPAGCNVCSINSDCPGGQVCRYNFCEAR